MAISELKVAIVHDWLIGLGGGERVVESLCKLFPGAEIFTSVYEPAKVPVLKNKTIHTSFLQHWPLAKRKHQLFSALRPLAFESFDFAGYDLVISTCSAESKGVVTTTETLHIGYIFTPIRYYWSGYEDYIAHPGFGPLNPVVRLALPAMVKKLRRWDYAAAQRPDYMVSIAQEVANRVKQYYGRESKVIFPPVSVERFLDGKSTDQGYYLLVSRLIPYKRADLAVRACTQLNKKLVVVGKGPELKGLKKLAGPTVEFAGALSDTEVNKLYLGAKAFLFPGFEDFGITPVEAMAAGKPVIFYNRGGVTETVVNGKTGLAFKSQTVGSLTAAIEKFEGMSWDMGVIRNQAKLFSEEHFHSAMRDFISEKISEK